MSGLVLAACGSSDLQTAPTIPPSAAASESTEYVGVESTEPVDPTTSIAAPPAPMSVPAPDISADLQQPLCRDLAPLLDGLVDPPLVPIGAREVGEPGIACEFWYAIPTHEPELVIGRMTPDGSQHNKYLLSQRTDDRDETSVRWDTGSVAYVDPTGADLFHLSRDAQVIVQRSDGSQLYVATYERDDESLAVEMARAFDNRLG